MFKVVCRFLLISVFSFCASAKEYTFAQSGAVLDAPAGFTLSDRFEGFEQVETFTTIRIDTSNKPLSEALASQMKSNLETIESENLTVGEFDGMLFKRKTMLGGNTFEQWLLLFGDTLGTVTITGTYPAEMAKSLGPIVKKAILSVKKKRLTKERLFKGLPFTLNETGSLRYYKRTANSVVLKDKAPYDESKVVAPFLVVSHSQTEQPIDDIKQFALTTLHNNKQFEDIRPQRQGPFTIASVASYKIVAKAKDKRTGQDVLFYQAVAVNDKRFLLIQGVAELNDFDRYLPMFDKITDGVAFAQSDYR